MTAELRELTQMPSAINNQNERSNTFYLWGAAGCFVAAFVPLGILIVASLFQFSTSSNILFVIKLEVVIFTIGLAVGVITQLLVGRTKGLAHNLVGLTLILVGLAGSMMTLTFFYDIALVGELGKAVGIASAMMALASASGLGRYCAARVQSRRQRK